MAQGPTEGQPLKLRLAAQFTQLPAPLVTVLAALLSEPPPSVDQDAPDDILNEKAASLLSELISAYIAGDSLAEIWNLNQHSRLPSLSEVSFALCTVVSNPATRKAKSVEDEGGTFAAGNPNLAPPPQGKRKVLPSWCIEYLHEKPSKHESRLVEEIKGGPQKLVSNRGGVIVSHDVDFGIQRATAQMSNEFNAFGLPSIPEVPRYFRTVLISNQGASEVLLLDVRSVPQMPDKLCLHDDFITSTGKLDGITEKGTPKQTVGVSLAPGAQYQVAVELRCGPQDAAHLQQWLLLSFIPAAAANAPKPANPSDQVFVIGRRVSALIAKSLADMQTILSVEAVPFFPASLRTLFDTPPATFLVGRKPALLKSTRLFDLLSTSSPPPAHKQMGALSFEPEIPFTLAPLQDMALWQPPIANAASKPGYAGVNSTVPAPLPGGAQVIGSGAPGVLPGFQPSPPVLMPFNPAPNPPPNPLFSPFPPLPALGQSPYQQVGPNLPFNPFANVPPLPMPHPPFIPLPNQPFPLIPHQSFQPPFFPRPHFPTPPSPRPAPLATIPANPMFNQHFPPLGSPTPRRPPSPKPVPQILPPMPPPIPVPQEEIQQMVFWLTGQIAQAMQRTFFATPQQAVSFHEFLRQSADLYLHNYINERTVQLNSGVPAQQTGPFVSGQGVFTPALQQGPFPLPAQSVPIPTPLPGPPPWGLRPGSAPAATGVNAPADGPALDSPNKAPNEKLPPGTPKSGAPASDRAAELGLPLDLSPEPVSILTPSDEGKVENKHADGKAQPILAGKRKQKRNRSGKNGSEEPGSTAAASDGVSTKVCACRDRQLRQLSRLLAMEETAMEKDIKAHDLFNVRLKLPSQNAPDTGPEMHLLALEVPGLPENRPSVLYADVVYIRLASAPHVEFAAFVWAVEMRPVPQVLLAISKSLFTAARIPVWKLDGEETVPHWVQALAREPVHARFTFDRLLLKRMHLALAKAALAPFPLLPCTCQPAPPLSLTSSSNVEKADTISRPHSSEATKPASANGVAEPSAIPAMEEDWADSFKPINGKLNRQQRQAVGSLLAGSCGRGPYIIFGPPGTGKTVTMVETCLQLLRLKGSPKIRLCVCAPSNFAADLVCSGIAAGGIGPDVMWRLNDPRRTLASVKQDVVSFCKYDNETGLFDVAASPSSYRVIVCTCGAAALLQEPPLAAAVGAFTHILVDEAGQALVPETLIAFGLAQKDSKVVLCGDPRQLGPVVHSQMAAQHGLAQSLLEWYMKAAAADADARGTPPAARSVSTPALAQADILRRLLPRESNPPAGVNAPEKAAKVAGNRGHTALSHRTHVVKLVRNYRSHRKLLELPSRMFYKDELVATAEASSVEPPRNWDEMQGSEFPMLFYGVKGQQMREGEAPSYFNPLEAERLVNLLAGLLQRAHISTGDIGVMAPYRKQVQKLRLLLRERGLGAVRVGTVDDYQGQEERVIFISTVLTRPESLRRGTKQGPDGSIGFLGNAKRFNVAITRAKALLVVVGHPVVLLEDENWSQLLRYCLQRDAYRGAGSEMVPRYVRHGPNDWTEGAEGEHEEYDEGDDDIAEAVGRIAELSLLGMGDMDRQFPEGLDSEYSAFSEDLEWRVVL